MKKINLIWSILFLLLLATSCKKINNQRATVVKNCVGIYLHYHGKSYSVCNYEVLSAYSDGDKITATIEKVDKCNKNPYPQSLCMYVYKSHGAIKILDIK